MVYKVGSYKDQGRQNNWYIGNSMDVLNHRLGKTRKRQVRKNEKQVKRQHPDWCSETKTKKKKKESTVNDL